jgi:hypothetical protein
MHKLDPVSLARKSVHGLVDEECRRIGVWIGIQACADRASLAGKSYTRSYGQLVRWRSTTTEKQ